ncbi:MAG: hypothetical protein ACYSWW_21715, partial [Planctomycetota bacterium]
IACRFPSLLCRKVLANPFGGIGMVSKSESSSVLASTSHQDRVFRRDTCHQNVTINTDFAEI